MEDIFDDNDGIQVVSSKNKDDVQYAAPEIVVEDKQGKPKGEVHGIKKDGGVLNGDKLTNEERERAQVQSLSSVRIFATYTNNNEPVDSPLHSVTFAGTGTMVCKAPDTKDTSTARLVTNDYVVGDLMPKVETLSDEQRRKYTISTITADPSVRAGSQYSDEHWQCEKLNSLKDNLEILRKATPSLDADFCFLKCTGPKESVESKAVMVPSLPTTEKKHQAAQGVGYPGNAPLGRHEAMFKGSADRQTLVLGDVKTGVSTDVFHELPTKPGMSGTTIAEAGTPTNTFQGVQNLYNGAVSTNNPAFVKQYDEHVVQEMPPNLPERTQAREFVQQARDEQQKQVTGWFENLWKR